MWRRTINHFGNYDNQMVELIEDPLRGFRIDPRLYKSPILIELFLYSLKGLFFVCFCNKFLKPNEQNLDSETKKLEKKIVYVEKCQNFF